MGVCVLNKLLSQQSQSARGLPCLTLTACSSAIASLSLRSTSVRKGATLPEEPNRSTLFWRSMQH